MSRRILAPAALGLTVLLLGGAPVAASTVDGSCLEEFELVNYQEQSATYLQSVSSSSYRNRATVFLLLSAG